MIGGGYSAARAVKKAAPIGPRAARRAAIYRNRNDRAPRMSLTLRPSQALKLWHDVTFDQVRDGAQDLTVRQTAILLTIYMDAPPHTVRGLAKKLGVTKPVITRALDTMGKIDLVTRRRDDNDRRNVVIGRTVAGALFVEKLGDMVIARCKELPR
jgi:DNA-binding MarR family transcriptional regulator